MDTAYRLGEWVIRPQHACIERGDEVIHLKPKPLAVLECLRRAQGEVVTREELFDRVWPGGVVSDATLTQCIVELRRAFDDSARAPRVIKTIPKVGFCLIPAVEEQADEFAKSEHSGHAERHRVLKKPALIGIALLIAALVVVAWWYQHDAARTAPETLVHDGGAAPSIAVLPFVNISDEPGNEYFADGLTEELQNLLAKIPQLKVTARTSSFAFRNKDLTVAEIAGILNVAHVLEGSVRKSDERIRISVQLIEAASGFELWSQSYDRTMDDVFAVQDDVAAAVVDAMRVKLINEPPRLTETDTEAYALFLQAIFFINQATSEGRARAFEKLQQVLAIDPNFAPAHGYLAIVYVTQSNALERPFDAGFELGRRSALDALVIDPNLSQANGILAYIESYYDWDWEAAGRRIKRALELAQMDGHSQNLVASHYQILGQFERSLEFRNRAIQRDPLVAYFREAKFHTLMSLGRLNEAEEVVRELIEIHPDYEPGHWLHAKVLLLSGDAEGALQLLQSLPEASHTYGLTAMALHSLGRVDEARIALDSLWSDSTTYIGGIAYRSALYYAWAGDRDAVFDYLEQALEARYRPLTYILGEPLFYSLHDDPRWLAILEELNLLTYWNELPEHYNDFAWQKAEDAGL
jgi:TolB-like protein/DNA-binding winged helix-turn-helix (wHTH) protein/Flp pilus assembly protein TadD